MVNLLPQPYEGMFMTFFFVYLRIAALLYTMPVMSNTTVIGAVRSGLAFWIAVIILAPVLGLNHRETGLALPGFEREFSGLVEFGVAASAEILIGLILGFMGQILIGSVAIAGDIMGRQAGFAAASVFDPITGIDVQLLAQVHTWFATLVFITIGGPQMFLSALVDSFHVVAPGAGVSIANVGTIGWEVMNFSEGQRVAMATLMFKVGILIAAPMMVATILVSIAEAFIARTAPQMNILAVGFAIRISLSLVLLYWMMPYTISRLSRYIVEYNDYAIAVLQRLG